MTDYLKGSFTVSMGGTDAFREGHDRIFGTKREAACTCGGVAKLREGPTVGSEMWQCVRCDRSWSQGAAGACTAPQVR